MINPKKYANKGEKSAIILPLIILATVLAGVTYFSYIAGIAVLLMYILFYFYLVLKAKSYMKKLEFISEISNEKLYSIVNSLSDFFNIEMPDIALIESEYIEVFALGFGQPYTLVISDTAFEYLTEEELVFALGQELGNISRKKVSMLTLLAPDGNVNSIMGLLFGSWQKKVELTSDRLGLIMNSNLEAGLCVLIKAFYEADDLERLDVVKTINMINSLKRNEIDELNDMLELDKYTINRIIKLVKYSRSKEYKQISNTIPMGLYSVKKDNSTKSVDEEISIGIEREKTLHRDYQKQDIKQSDYKKEELQFRDYEKELKENLNSFKTEPKEDPFVYEMEEEKIKPKVNDEVAVDELRDEYDDGEYEEYEKDSNGTKKLFIALSILLIIVISGLFVAKKFLFSDGSQTNNTTVSKGENDKKEPIDEISDEEALKGLINGVEGFTPVDTKIIDNHAYVKAENSDKMARIYLAYKENDTWSLKSFINDKNPNDSLDEVFDFTFKNSSFDSNIQYTRKDSNGNVHVIKDINNSKRVEGEEAVNIAKALEDFNDAWVEFVNSGNRAKVESLVQEGGKSHRIINNFNISGLKQKYFKHKINDIRQGEKCYYVWLHEKIEEDKNGSVKVSEYHWIYKLVKENGKYVIVEYNFDPVFKR